MTTPATEEDKVLNDFARPVEFPLGVWLAPSYDMGKWKGRGCNCVFEVPYGNDPTQWSNEAQLNGLWQIRSPLADYANGPAMVKDAHTSGLMAWSHADEPDAAKVDPNLLQANYAAMKAAAPRLPVAINFSNSYVVGWPNGTPPAIYPEYIKAADWLGNDLYPVTGWSVPDSLRAVSQVVEVMNQWSNKKKYVFIECGNQNQSWVATERGPTAVETLVQIWTAVVHGIKGIMYVPSQAGGFQYDVTPPEIVATLSVANWQITKWACYFAKGGYQFLDTGNSSVHAASWTSGSGTLKIAVNWTNQSQTAMGVSFGPMEVKFLETANQGQPDVEERQMSTGMDRLTALEYQSRLHRRQINSIGSQMASVVIPALQKNKLLTK